jgi:hypothetical protein
MTSLRSHPELLVTVMFGQFNCACAVLAVKKTASATNTTATAAASLLIDVVIVMIPCDDWGACGSDVSPEIFSATEVRERVRRA